MIYQSFVYAKKTISTPSWQKQVTAKIKFILILSEKH